MTTTSFTSYIPLIVLIVVVLLLLVWFLVRRSQHLANRTAREEHEAAEARNITAASPETSEPLSEIRPEPVTATQAEPISETPEAAIVPPSEASPVATPTPDPVLPATPAAVTIGEGTPPEMPVTRPAGAPADNLLQMKGLGPKLKNRLNELGITRFEQIAAWGPDDVAEVNRHLGNFAGRIERDQWVDQARYLAAGDIAGFEAKYGKL